MNKANKNKKDVNLDHIELTSIDQRTNVVNLKRIETTSTFFVWPPIFSNLFDHNSLILFGNKKPTRLA